MNRLKQNILDRVFYFNKNNYLVKWNDYKSIEKTYWTAVFENITSPLKFIVTENYRYLPEYGDDIIVILKSDEFTSHIEYISRIKAVFRNYFSEKYLHNKKVFFLPLPYLGEMSKISNTPILNRKTDVFFVGQVAYTTRRELLNIVLSMKKQRGNLKIIFRKTQGFFTGWDINTYVNNLSNSKISLCPRGTSVETYRHFESLCHGCATISMPLPDVWYFQNAPIQIIQQWEELPILLYRLINNKNLLEEISQKSIEYWNTKLSPRAVANFIGTSIDSLCKT